MHKLIFTIFILCSFLLPPVVLGQSTDGYSPRIKAIMEKEAELESRCPIVSLPISTKSSGLSIRCLEDGGIHLHFTGHDFKSPVKPDAGFKVIEGLCKVSYKFHEEPLVNEQWTCQNMILSSSDWTKRDYTKQKATLLAFKILSKSDIEGWEYFDLQSFSIENVDGNVINLRVDQKKPPINISDLCFTCRK